MQTKILKSFKLSTEFYISLFIIFIIHSYNCGENHLDIPFIERLQPVPHASGFKMDGYWIWGGSVLEVNSTYHLFVSRWPKYDKFPQDYRHHSEIVRATSNNPLGPYTFQEVVIGERDSLYWDSNMAHNPTIHKIADKYVLFYIGSDFKTFHPNKKNLIRSIGYATARSIEGPWRRSDKPIIDQESNNPAVFAEKDGTIKLMFRDADLRVFLAIAPSYEGPYTIINDNVWPSCKLEDFYIFYRNHQYHCICEDNVGKVSGHIRWGIHLVSDNGIRAWKKYEPVIVYDHELKYDDGYILKCIRRERPQLLIENGKIVCLITAVYDGDNSWCQPVAVYPAY